MKAQKKRIKPAGSYVDGFVLPIPKKYLGNYRSVAAKAGKLWIEHGAVEYRECVAEDVKTKELLPFPKMIKAKSTETVVFAFIVFRSRKHRDTVNKKVMSDPRMAKMADEMKVIPFDMKRMAYGGFKSIVNA